MTTGKSGAILILCTMLVIFGSLRFGRVWSADSMQTAKLNAAIQNLKENGKAQTLLIDRACRPRTRAGELPRGTLT